MVPTYSASILGTLLSSQGAGAHRDIWPFYRTVCRGATRPKVVSRSRRVKSLNLPSTWQNSLSFALNSFCKVCHRDRPQMLSHPVRYSLSATCPTLVIHSQRVKSLRFHDERPIFVQHCCCDDPWTGYHRDWPRTLFASGPLLYRGNGVNHTWASNRESNRAL